MIRANSDAEYLIDRLHWIRKLKLEANTDEECGHWIAIEAHTLARVHEAIERENANRPIARPASPK